MRDPDRGTRRILEHPVLGPLLGQPTVHISFDGQELDAIEGEPIMVMLLAHGIRITRTMPETGAPRGLFCGVGRCPDCIMTVDGELNVRTCVTSVRDGMIIETQRGLGAWRADR